MLRVCGTLILIILISWLELIILIHFRIEFISKLIFLIFIERIKSSTAIHELNQSITQPVGYIALLIVPWNRLVCCAGDDFVAVSPSLIDFGSILIAERWERSPDSVEMRNRSLRSCVPSAFAWWRPDLAMATWWTLPSSGSDKYES